MNREVMGTEDIQIEMDKAKDEMVKNCSRIKGKTANFIVGKKEMREIWKEYLQNMCNMDTEE